MDLELWRYSGGTDATLGMLMLVEDPGYTCLGFVVEDEYREEKVAGETRIPAGRYRITLRTEGGMSARYRTRYGPRHRGMLWLRDVPGFEWVYIHAGNTEADSRGCLIIGNQRDERTRSVEQSRLAYWHAYELIRPAVVSGEAVTITVYDFDRPRRPTGKRLA